MSPKIFCACQVFYPSSVSERAGALTAAEILWDAVDGEKENATQEADLSCPSRATLKGEQQASLKVV